MDKDGSTLYSLMNTSNSRPGLIMDIHVHLLSCFEVPHGTHDTLSIAIIKRYTENLC